MGFNRFLGFVADLVYFSKTWEELQRGLASLIEAFCSILVGWLAGSQWIWIDFHCFFVDLVS